MPRTDPRIDRRVGDEFGSQQRRCGRGSEGAHRSAGSFAGMPSDQPLTGLVTRRSMNGCGHRERALLHHCAIPTGMIQEVRHGARGLAHLVGRRGIADGVVTRVVIPPAAWLALTLLPSTRRDRCRSCRACRACGWRLYRPAIGDRGILPVPVTPLAIVAFYHDGGSPFVLDRFVALGGLGSTLFPLALSPPSSCGRGSRRPRRGSINTRMRIHSLMQVAAFIGLWGITFVVTWFASTLTGHGAAGWWGVRPVLTCAAVFGDRVQRHGALPWRQRPGRPSAWRR